MRRESEVDHTSLVTTHCGDWKDPECVEISRDSQQQIEMSGKIDCPMCWSQEKEREGKMGIGGVVSGGGAIIAPI